MTRSIATDRSDRAWRAARTRAGFTLIEVLVSLSILTAGVLAILAVLPSMLQANERAELRTMGASLALQKIEEIRRDNDAGGQLLNKIKNLRVPTDPVEFAAERRLSYRFSGITLLYRGPLNPSGLGDDPNDDRDDPGVARVIIQLSPGFSRRRVILDEYRFN